MGCQRDPRIWGVTAWYQSIGKQLPRELGCGYHKYGLDTSSCQLGIKSLGTRMPRADRYGSRSSDSLSSCVVVCISEGRYVVTYENDGHWV